MQFKGFKPQAMQRIAGNLGYQGDMSGFNDYLNQNPDKMSKMNMYQNKAMEMAKGGMVKKPNYAVGGVTTLPTASKLPNPFEDPIIGKQSPDVDQGFYNSQEYRDFQNDPNNRVGSTDMYDSPYFGSMGSGSLGQAQDRAYEAYLANQTATVDPRTSVGGVPQTGAYAGESVSELIANRAVDPSLAYGATVQPVGTQVTGDQLVDPRSGAGNR